MDSIFGFHPTNSFYAMGVFAIMASCGSSIWWIDNIKSATKLSMVVGAFISLIGINVGLAALAHSMALFMAG